jgi:hypothetical protein
VFDNERHEGPRGRQQCTVLPGNQGEVLTHPRPAVDTRTQPDSLPISGDRFPLSATRTKAKPTVRQTAPPLNPDLDLKLSRSTTK